jgi:hypothetical protein
METSLASGTVVFVAKCCQPRFSWLKVTYIRRPSAFLPKIPSPSDFSTAPARAQSIINHTLELSADLAFSF